MRTSWVLYLGVGLPGTLVVRQPPRPGWLVRKLKRRMADGALGLCMADVRWLKPARTYAEMDGAGRRPGSMGLARPPRPGLASPCPLPAVNGPAGREPRGWPSEVHPPDVDGIRGEGYGHEAPSATRKRDRTSSPHGYVPLTRSVIASIARRKPCTKPPKVGFAWFPVCSWAPDGPI